MTNTVDKSTLLKLIEIQNDLYYKSGDIVYLNNLVIPAHISDGCKCLTFSIPLRKKLDDISNFNITSLKANIRTCNTSYLTNNGAWLAEGQELVTNDLTVSWKIVSVNTNSLTVDFEYSTAWSRGTNNSNLVFEIKTGTIVLL